MAKQRDAVRMSDQEIGSFVESRVAGLYQRLVELPRQGGDAFRPGPGLKQHSAEIEEQGLRSDRHGLVVHRLHT